ncbi:hypothetical protein ACFYOV_18605 [Streptomyces sp. NPDC005931]|uniref:hypothetical protein n=1 Tax=Streptomyces sp. NPDC005931 TaxID=3364737 RepID=UPI0036A48C53
MGVATKAVWIIGPHKVVPGLGTALRRIEEQALALGCARALEQALALEEARARAVHGTPSVVNRLLILDTDLPRSGGTVLPLPDGGYRAVPKACVQ